MKNALPRLIAAGLLLWAMGNHPYSYYQILRWVVCGVSGYSAYIAYERKNNAWTWIFGVMAVLFNPIAPIYLDRETWVLLDLVAAVLMFASFYWLRPTQRSPQQ
jgi:hypothetical protein